MMGTGGLVVLVLAGLGVVLGLAGIGAFSHTLENEPTTQEITSLEGHFVVADAGSTHTEFTLYKWEAPCLCNETAIFGTFARQLPFECDIKPGISSQSPGEVTAIVQSCLAQAAGNLSREVAGKTPFMLRATAGMRLLNFSSPEQSDGILQAVRSGTEGTPFENAGDSDAAAILSGEDEGAFSWTTANYLEGTLTSALEASHRDGMRAVRAVGTVGALDLGGASTQITFVPTDGGAVSPQDNAVLNLYGETIEVYTHSYLCYGASQMAVRRLAMLLNTSDPDGDSVVDPCYAIGYTSDEFTLGYLEELAANPCVDGLVTFNITAFEGSSRTGGSDTTQCRATITPLFSGDAVEEAALPLDANGKFVAAVARQPSLPSGNIYAFSAFWYAANFLFPHTCTSTSLCNPTWAEYTTMAEELCAQNLSTVIDEHPGTDLQYAIEYCQNSMYISTLLSQYGMLPDANNVYFVNKIDSTSVGWNFGLALNASATVTPITKSESQPYTSGRATQAKGEIAGAVLLTIVSAIVFVVIIRRRKNRNQYESLNTSSQSNYESLPQYE
mmetsp:Transcript_15143/g.38925  ORF Transcript_15143/g.38925 Transcript_15143/m.38925 type:complete len:557 (-) Transcript_15143:1913-3583(-)